MVLEHIEIAIVRIGASGREAIMLRFVVEVLVQLFHLGVTTTDRQGDVA